MNKTNRQENFDKTLLNPQKAFEYLKSSKKFMKTLQIESFVHNISGVVSRNT